MKTNWRIELALLAAHRGDVRRRRSSCGRTAPSEIPVHWNASGEVDRYGGKFEGLLGIPLMALGIYLLMRFRPAHRPRARELRPLRRRVHGDPRGPASALRRHLRGRPRLGAEMRPSTCHGRCPSLSARSSCSFGAVLGKVRPNWFVGIRTPWTLSSKRSWVRTHRLGGWLFMALGVLFAVTGVFKLGVLASGSSAP